MILSHKPISFLVVGLGFYSLAFTWSLNAQASSSKKIGVFVKTNMVDDPAVDQGVEGVGRAEISYIKPDGTGTVKYVLLAGNPVTVRPNKETKLLANNMIQSMLNFDSQRRGVDLGQDPFPGVDFGKNKTPPKNSEFNCFGYALMSALGKGNAGFYDKNYWVEPKKSDRTKGGNPYHEILSNFFKPLEPGGIYNPEDFEKVAKNPTIHAGDIVNLTANSGEDIHAGVIVMHGNERWVRSKLGEERVIEVPLERLLITYKAAARAQIYRPDPSIVKDPMITPVLEIARSGDAPAPQAPRNQTGAP